jgi:ABC-type proline/glycine betaine transport system permease subunit
MDRSQLLKGGLILGAMVLVPGIAKYVLTELGYATLGSMVWYGGYGLGVVLVWALWIRPLDITGPTDPDHPGE